MNVYDVTVEQYTGGYLKVEKEIKGVKAIDAEFAVYSARDKHRRSKQYLLATPVEVSRVIRRVRG